MEHILDLSDTLDYNAFIEMKLCQGCTAVWIPENIHHCDGCIDHAKAVIETGGEG